MIETPSALLRLLFSCLRQSAENVRKCSETFVWLSDTFLKIFGKWSEIFGRSPKTLLSVCLYNKQNITCLLVFSHVQHYLTRSLHSLVRYQVEHLKIKFVSTHGHVISSTCIIWLVFVADITYTVTG